MGLVKQLKGKFKCNYIDFRGISTHFAIWSPSKSRPETTCRKAAPGVIPVQPFYFCFVLFRIPGFRLEGS